MLESTNYVLTDTGSGVFRTTYQMNLGDVYQFDQISLSATIPADFNNIYDQEFASVFLEAVIASEDTVPTNPGMWANIVPEGSSLIMMLSGLMAVLLMPRRGKR